MEIQQEDTDADRHYALVEFKTVGDAANVLSSSSNQVHRIEGCDVEVKAAEPQQQPDYILNALNPDCLRAIFLQLNLCDLMNAANVCVAFNEEAKSVFSTKHKQLVLGHGSRSKAKKLLQTFGSVAQSVDVNADCFTSVKIDYEIEILAMVAQYCTAASLKELILRDFSFENEQPNDINFAHAFANLARISFINCHYRNQMNGVLGACAAELKVLHFQGCHQHQDQTIWPKFDHLDEFQLFNMPNIHQFMLGFCTSNSPLMKISLIERGDFLSNNPSRTVLAIVQHYSNLQEFEFKMRITVDAELTQCVRHLDYLTSLRVLKFNLNGKSVERLGTILTANALPIEHMELICGVIDTEAVKAIAQMNRLKVLELWNVIGLTDEHLVELAKGLGSRLETFKLDGKTAYEITTIGVKLMLTFAIKLSHLSLKTDKLIINANDYQEMLETVQKRPEIVQFVLQLFGNGNQVNVNKTVLMENRDCFDIDENIHRDFVRRNPNYEQVIAAGLGLLGPWLAR